MQDLDDAVVTLYDIARLVEKTLGTGGALAADIHSIADRLNEVLRLNSKYGNSPTNFDPDKVYKNTASGKLQEGWE